MRLRLDLTDGAAAPTGTATQHIVQQASVIGRSPECDWQLTCPERLISRRHAMITREDDGFVVYDASANGIYVNGADSPLGEGGRAVLRDGDRLTLGRFALAVTLLDGPREASADEGAGDWAPAADDPKAEPPAPEPVPPAPTARAANGPDLGETRDAFQPPTAIIPEDWDFDIGEWAQQEDTTPGQAVSRQLDALQPATLRALLDGLGQEEVQLEAVQLDAAQAHALGSALRHSLEAVLSVHKELNNIEHVLPRGRVDARSSAATRADVQAITRGLLGGDEAERNRQLDRVEATAQQLPGRSSRIAAALARSAGTVVRLFEPPRFEQRARRQAFAPRRGWARLRGLWWRGRLRLNPRAQYWRAFNRWYRERGDTPEGAVQALFQKDLRRIILSSREEWTQRPAGTGTSGADQ